MRLCAPAAKVSAHYLVSRSGAVFQLVEESQRAWHAGVAGWHDIADVNSASIGIELDHPGHLPDGRMAPYAEAQITALIALGLDIVARHAIAPAHVLGHSDVAPTRKTDPGEALDWPRLAAAGLGLWPDDCAVQMVGPLGEGDRGPDVAALQHALASYGYQLHENGVFGPQMVAVIRAFQRHFRPRQVDGVADAQIRTLVHSVCRAANA